MGAIFGYRLWASCCVVGSVLCDAARSFACVDHHVDGSVPNGLTFRRPPGGLPDDEKDSLRRSIMSRAHRKHEVPKASRAFVGVGGARFVAQVAVGVGTIEVVLALRQAPPCASPTDVCIILWRWRVSCARCGRRGLGAPPAHDAAERAAAAAPPCATLQAARRASCRVPVFLGELEASAALAAVLRRFHVFRLCRLNTGEAKEKGARADKLAHTLSCLHVWHVRAAGAAAPAPPEPPPLTGGHLSSRLGAGVLRPPGPCCIALRPWAGLSRWPWGRHPLGRAPLRHSPQGPRCALRCGSASRGRRRRERCIGLCGRADQAQCAEMCVLRVLE